MPDQILPFLYYRNGGGGKDGAVQTSIHQTKITHNRHFYAITVKQRPKSCIAEISKTKTRISHSI